MYWSACIFSNLFLFSLHIYPGMELLDHMILLFLVFWESSILFSILAAKINIPTNSVLGFPFLHILVNIVICRLFDGKHSERCISCCFDLHFPNSDIGQLFMCLLAICVYSLKNVYSSLLLMFWLSSLFLNLSCMSCLYILDINSLLVISFANIFYHFVSCLFILLMVFFAMKAFNLEIKSF